MTIPEQPDLICIEWAEDLLAASRGDALSLRGAMERVKVAATRELNAARKLLAMASTSHHALYQCVVLLRDSPARTVIRGLLLSGGDPSSTTPAQQDSLAMAIRLALLLPREAALTQQARLY
jgi:hypothetical protein